MAAQGSVTVVGRLATLRGELTGDGDVQIDGTLDGSVSVPGARITVGPEATVKAQLSATDIIVYGRVEGELRATSRAELRSSANLTGNVFAARLAIEGEATMVGQVDLTPPAEPGEKSTEPSAPMPSGLAAAAAKIAKPE